MSAIEELRKLRDYAKEMSTQCGPTYADGLQVMASRIGIRLAELQAADRAEGGECKDCVWRKGLECHRFPPEVTQQAYLHPSAVYQDAQWGFAPAGTRCGEHLTKDKP